MRTFKVRDESWTSRETKVTGTLEALAAIDALAVAHEAASRRAAAALTPEERAARAGFSFVLTDARGNSLLGGAHPEGWILLRLKPAPMRAVRGELTGETPVVFLFPEWTEFARRELVSAERARVILKRWMETGELPLE